MRGSRKNQQLFQTQRRALPAVSVVKPCSPGCQAEQGATPGDQAAASRTPLLLLLGSVHRSYLLAPRGKGLGTLRPSHAAKPKSLALLQRKGLSPELFPTQGSNLGLPRGRQVLHPLSQQGGLTKAHTSGSGGCVCKYARRREWGPRVDPECWWP